MFKKLFPVCAVTVDYDTDRSPFAGQIRNSNNDGIGTGTLIKMEIIDNEIRVIGITALHNFVSFSKKDCLTISPKFTKIFSMGSKAHPTEEGGFAFGSALIDKVMVQANPSKDICLFEGDFSCNQDIFTSNKEFYKKLHSYLPTIVNNKMNVSDTYNKACIFHYPLGKKDQRRNEGKASGNGRHKIESLFGSSGAALFKNESEIFGIHTGVSGKDLRKDVIAEYDEDKDIPISEFNMFELISMQEYNELKDGVDILGGSNLTKEFMKALSSLAENL